MAELTIQPANQQNKFLLRTKTVEYVDFSLLKKVEKCNGLKDHWDKSDKGKYREQCFKNEKQMVIDYSKKYSPTLTAVPVVFSVSKSGYGRAFAHKGMSLAFMRKDIRHTLCQDYYDIDLVNCQVSILYNLLKSNSLAVPESLEKYAMERNEILTTISDSMNVEKECAKELFLRLMFFGTYEGFKIDMKDHGTNVPDVCPPFVKRFQEDLKLLVPVLREKNMN